MVGRANRRAAAHRRSVGRCDELGGLRVDWLAAFQPTPGTVAFLGYGSSHESPSATSLAGLRRMADGVFVKLAYQFRR